MKLDLEFNTYKGWETKSIYQTLKLEEILELIRTGEDAEEIQVARQFGKGHDLYNFIKSRRQMISWNCTFTNGKTEANLKAFTGLVFMDKDNLTEQQVVELKALLMLRSDVVACWRSFGGNGIGCLIKVDGITKENFSNAWNEINQEINIEFDKGVKKLVQLNALSYDPDLRYNKDATSFSFKVKPLSLSTEQNISSHKKHKNVEEFDRIRSEEDLGILLKKTTHLRGLTPLAKRPFKSKIRLKTEIDAKYFDNTGTAEFDQPIEFVKVDCKYKIKEGRRNSCLIAIAASLIELNHAENKGLMFDHLKFINENQCTPPLPIKEVSNIFNYCLKKYKAGSLIVKPRKRSIVFNESCTLSRIERFQRCAKISARIKRNKTQEQIKFTIELLKEKQQIILQKDVATNCGKCRETIQKYWPLFKDDVDKYNNSINQNLI